MKKSIQSVFLAFVFLTVLLSGCAPASTPVLPTFTPSPIPPTFTPEPTRTIVPATATATPTATPTEAPDYPGYTMVDIGSPFAADCGDGKPRRTCDTSTNGINAYYPDGIYGHVDMAPPIGCDVTTYQGEIVAPVPGYLTGDPNGSPSYFLKLPEKTLINGLDKVLAHAGVTDFDPDKVQRLYLNIAHFNVLRDLPKGILLEQGRPIADLAPLYGHAEGEITAIIFAMQVEVMYKQVFYIFSPSMFLIETGKPLWECIPRDMTVQLRPGQPRVEVPGIDLCNPQYNFHQ